MTLKLNQHTKNCINDPLDRSFQQKLYIQGLKNRRKAIEGTVILAMQV